MAKPQNAEQAVPEERETMRIHTDRAWAIASLWSWALAADTRTLAAQIDDEFDKLLDECADLANTYAENYPLHSDGRNTFQILASVIQSKKREARLMLDAQRETQATGSSTDGRGE